MIGYINKYDFKNEINNTLKGFKERAAFLQNQAASKPIFNLTNIKNQTMANTIVDGIERIKVSQPTERTYTQEEVDAIEKRAFTHGVYDVSKGVNIEDMYALYKTFNPLNNNL